ncbi:hypothetical protein BJY16_005883 [Actinoplanes octamycinicus]|uniref:Uncharacterized protein n=1 Tax=Actinoplanes octamycinicus TaxID=135948 RepID=A0A7W7H246_9ACTN|nr:hypothetical protein [Actinoplanes octamycinicus]MBB4742424.1 hypothetical protein [Actinoplanes octamycinicus]
MSRHRTRLPVRTQRDTPVYVTPYGTYGVVPGTPASAQVVREALAAAKR